MTDSTRKPPSFYDNFERKEEGTMSFLRKIDSWSERNQSIVLDAFRFLLGLVLIIKGVQFGQNPRDLQVIIAGTPFDFADWMIIHYIIMVHLAGGAFIMIGLLTRLSILFQLPILICALFFSRSTELFSFYTGTVQALIVLAGLILFLFYGSGKYSVDEYLEKTG